jgi:hypothetical protein
MLGYFVKSLHSTSTDLAAAGSIRGNWPAHTTRSLEHDGLLPFCVSSYGGPPLRAAGGAIDEHPDLTRRGHGGQRRGRAEWHPVRPIARPRRLAITQLVIGSGLRSLHSMREGRSMTQVGANPTRASEDCVP